MLSLCNILFSNDNQRRNNQKLQQNTRDGHCNSSGPKSRQSKGADIQSGTKETGQSPNQAPRNHRYYQRHIQEASFLRQQTMQQTGKCIGQSMFPICGICPVRKGSARARARKSDAYTSLLILRIIGTRSFYSSYPTQYQPARESDRSQNKASP